jgi:hypothetical protein
MGLSKDELRGRLRESEMAKATLLDELSDLSAIATAAVKVVTDAIVVCDGCVLAKHTDGCQCHLHISLSELRKRLQSAHDRNNGQNAG